MPWRCASSYVDAVVRTMPGALGAETGAHDESFADGLLEYPQYTRPAEWEGIPVPEVLTTGDHGAIAKWRRQQRLLATRKNRPDLYARSPLSKKDLDLLK